MTAAVSEFRELVLENARLLDGFRAKGVDLTSRVELHFICDLPDETIVEQAIEALKTRFESAPLPAEAQNPRFAICTDEEESYWELMLTVDALLDSAVVSAIEYAVGRETTHLGGQDVAWEFADPRNGQKETLQ